MYCKQNVTNGVVILDVFHRLMYLKLMVSNADAFVLLNVQSIYAKILQMVKWLSSMIWNHTHFHITNLFQ